MPLPPALPRLSVEGASHWLTSLFIVILLLLLLIIVLLMFDLLLLVMIIIIVRLLLIILLRILIILLLIIMIILLRILMCVILLNIQLSIIITILLIILLALHRADFAAVTRSLDSLLQAETWSRNECHPHEAPGLRLTAVPRAFAHFLDEAHSWIHSRAHLTPSCHLLWT